MSLLRRIEGAAPPANGTHTLSPLQDEARTLNPSPAKSSADQFDGLRLRVQQKLIAELDPKLDLSQTAQVRRLIEDLFTAILEQEGIVLPRAERQKLFEATVAEILGLGPIEPLLADQTISEIMVNGPHHVWIERAGKLLKTDITFQNNDHVLRVIDRIVSPIGRRCDESTPYVDGRLTEGPAAGSRVHAIIPPLALDGPTITIRKFRKDRITDEEYCRFGTVTTDMLAFLAAAVEAKLNIIISGGTGSGKTTLLNILSGYIPDDERIITIEDAAELQLRQEHVIRMETRRANIEGKGEITVRDLVVQALRMRPERIVVGECRRGEALDMLQAMNTGHDGSMTTLHSNNPREALSRLETMVLMAGLDLPVRAIRDQVASAIDVIVQLSRMRDGSRKVTHITEVQGIEGDVIVLQDIFLFEQTGFQDDKVLGRLRPTGIRPKFYEKFEIAGVRLAPDVFMEKTALWR
ncbi:MAG: CpaF family protein [Chloroflexota bacterium]